MKCPVCESPGCRGFMTVDGRDYLECPECLAVFLDPSSLLSPEEEFGRYREHNNDPSDPAYRAFLGRLSGPLLERLSPGLRGLDYGCGPGPALAEVLREAGYQVDLFDPFFEPNERVFEKEYDFIVCSEVAEHFHTPGREFEKLRDLLKPGGFMGVMTCFLGENIDFAGWRYRRDPTHVVFYRERTFQILAERQGWELCIPYVNVVFMTRALSA